jgi:hypothetical protein
MPTQQQKYPYPSIYGSHKSMVTAEHDDGTVTCKDEYGEYVTTRDRLDSGLADPRRYATSRTQKLHREEQAAGA